jgi:thiamine-phosphate pyrophosphorylase
VCEPVGLTYLDFVVRNIKIPFVAIGGIKEKNLLSVVERGAKCAALVTEITEAENIEEKILNLRKIFSK